jgi:hypothetical protein
LPDEERFTEAKSIIASVFCLKPDEDVRISPYTPTAVERRMSMPASLYFDTGEVQE